MPVDVQRYPGRNTDKDIEIRKDGPKDDDTMELGSITGAGPTSSYFMEAMLDGRIKKLCFKDDLDTGKRKQIKRKLLLENKGVLLLDIRQECNSKTEDHKDIACDIILVAKHN